MGSTVGDYDLDDNRLDVLLKYIHNREGVERLNMLVRTVS